MKLSIVTTMYYSASYVEEFHKRIIAEAEKITSDIEVIFVDDGSPDNSLEVAVALNQKDPRAKVVELSRNFGHHKAIVAGLEYASGDYIFLIDSDLEEPPELLSSFWEKLQNENLDVVYGVLEERRGGFLDKFIGKMYYKIFNKLADKANTEPNLTTVRLMTKIYVDKLVEYKSKDYFFAPICSLVGFKQESVVVPKDNSSPTTYKFFLKYHLLVNSIFAYSSKPLYFIFYTGLSISFFSFLFVIYLLIKKFYMGVETDGWTSLIVSIFVSLGLIMSSMGVVAIYLSKIHNETKKEPFVSIKKIYD